MFEPCRDIPRVTDLPEEGPNASLPDVTEMAAYERALAEYTVGQPQQPLTAPIEIADHDPTWPSSYERKASRIRSILSNRVLRIEHVGSTSVNGLPAKPIIDIALRCWILPTRPRTYPISRPRLRAADPRSRLVPASVLQGPDTNINLHTFSAGCAEVDRMLAFRDWLRANAADRELYVRTKRKLAAQDWKYMQQYADAKTAVVKEIMAHAETAAL